MRLCGLTKLFSGRYLAKFLAEPFFSCIIPEKERKKEREIAKADGADVHETQMRDIFLIVKTKSKKN